MPNQGWQQQQPPPQWGPPPPQRGGSFGLAVAVAVGALGVAVFWAILGLKGFIGKRLHDVDPEGLIARLAKTGGNADLLVPLSIVGNVCDLLAMAALLTGALLIFIRKLPGAFIIAAAGVLGLLAATCRLVYYMQLDWSAPIEPYLAAGLTLLVTLLAILPPVTRSLRPAAQPQFGHAQHARQQPPPPGYGPPQGPPEAGYGPPR